MMRKDKGRRRPTCGHRLPQAAAPGASRDKDGDRPFEGRQPPILKGQTPTQLDAVLRRGSGICRRARIVLFGPATGTQPLRPVHEDKCRRPVWAGRLLGRKNAYGPYLMTPDFAAARNS